MHALDDAVVRHDELRALGVRQFLRGYGYDEPIPDPGRWEHEGAGRPAIDPWLHSESVTWPLLATSADAPRARISRCRIARRLSFKRVENGGRHARINGLDRPWLAEAVAWHDGRLSRLGRVRN